MINKIKILTTTQWAFFCILFFFVVTPLGLFYQFSPYDLPYVSYVIMAYIILSQHFYFNEKSYFKKVWPKAQAQLQKERGRGPSKNDIIQRVHFIASCRRATLGLNIVFIFLLMIVYKKLL